MCIRDSLCATACPVGINTGLLIKELRWKENGALANAKMCIRDSFNPVLHYDQKLGKRWSASLHGDFVRADGQYPYTLINGELETREKRRNSDIHAYHLEGNLFGDFGRGGELSFKAYYFDSERGLPGSVNLYNKNTSERLWDNNFFVQSGYKNVLNEKFTLRAMAK